MPTSEPLTERGRRTARELRVAARRVFADRGYADARVEDVVAAAGVSHGTFYTYYENKADVLDALVDDTAEALLAVAAAPWEGSDGPSAVRDVITRFLEVFADDADVIRVWIEASAHEPRFRARLREVRTGYIDRVAEQLEPVLNGTAHEPTVAAAALVSLVEGYATQGQTVGAAQDAAVDTLVGLWVGGLRELQAG